MSTQSALIGYARLIVKVFTFAVAIVVATGTGRAEDERRVIEGEAFIHDLQPVTLELRTQSGTEILRLVGVEPMTAEVICGADMHCLEILALQPDLGAAFRGTPLVHDTVCTTLGIRDEFGQSFAICRERFLGIAGYRMGLDSAEVLVLDGIVLNDPHMLPDYSEQEATAKRQRTGLWSVWP